MVRIIFRQLFFLLFCVAACRGQTSSAAATAAATAWFTDLKGDNTGHTVANFLSLPISAGNLAIGELATAGMMDATLGVTALSWAIARQQLCATVEFNTHFFAPVKAGDRLEGTGDIDFSGSSLVVTTAHITDTTTGQLVAKGIGTFSLYPLARRKDLLALLNQQDD